MQTPLIWRCYNLYCRTRNSRFPASRSLKTTCSCVRSGRAALSALLMWHSILSLHWLWNGGVEAQPSRHRSSLVEALYVLERSSFYVDSDCILMIPQWQQSVGNTNTCSIQHLYTGLWPYLNSKWVKLDGAGGEDHDFLTIMIKWWTVNLWDTSMKILW